MDVNKMGLRILAVLIIAATLVGCSNQAPEIPTAAPLQPTINVQPTVFAAQTQAVQTYIANQTQNAPTATRVPPTLAPTATQAVTATPLATVVKATDIPTQRPAAPTAKPAVHCSVKSSYPTETDILAPNTSFTAVFTILNTGTETWTTSYTINYVSGARFANQSTQKLPFSVEGNSDITLTMKLTTLSAPGTYKAVWGILNGFQPVCLMSLAVTVK